MSLDERQIDMHELLDTGVVDPESLPDVIEPIERAIQIELPQTVASQEPSLEDLWQPPVRGDEGYCPIVVLCDAPTPEAHEAGIPMHAKHHNWFGKVAKKHGFVPGDIKLVGLCPPISRVDLSSDSRQTKHVEKFQDKVKEKIRQLNPRVVVTMGKLATRVMTGRPAAVTKMRGIPIIQEDGSVLLPMLSPGYVRRLPEHVPAFDADVGTLARIKAADYDPLFFAPQDGNYEWVDHLPTWLAMHGAREGFADAKVISVDTETQKGIRWWDDEVKLLSVQIAWKTGHALVVPVCEDWCGHPEKAGNYDANRRELKRILENPEIRKVGHNIKFEHLQCRKIGIEIQGWLHDTQLMLFNVDENLSDKSLDNGIRVFVPQMAGYSDELNESEDKSNMAAVEKGKFIRYSGGDADATMRLCRTLKPRLDEDVRQRNCYRHIQMPGILSFANTIEPHGMLVNTERLTQFAHDLDEWITQAYADLIARVPAHIKQRHLDQPNQRGKPAHKVLSFTRDDFTRDILFSPDGFALTPKVWTDSTAELPDDQKVPSVSGKKHLPYFTSDQRIIIGTESTVGDFVADLIQLGKAQKLKTTYVGQPAHEMQNGRGETIQVEATGIWQYLAPWSRIHPSYMLHRTNTGRTASADPNGQNFPNKGNWAKQYKAIFEAAPGFTLVSCDLSQIELRLVAWMAHDTEMLRIYNSGGDIHTLTAARVLGVTYEEMMSWKKREDLLQDVAHQVKGADDYLSKLTPDKRATATLGDYYNQKRFGAKAINFGFIYGMSAGGFQTYAKTEYGIDYTDEECWKIRHNFFETYWGLPNWHNTMHRFAEDNGFVRALHGSVRHLPGIYSEDEAIRAMARRQAVNAPIQRFGSDLGVIAQARFCAQAPAEIIKVNGFVHDALYMEVRDDVAQEAASALKWCMETPPLKEWFGLEPPLPLLSEAEIGGEEVDIEAIKPSWWNDDEAAARAQYLAINRSNML